MVGYSGTGSGSMGYLWYTSTHPISYTLGCPFCTRRWLPCYDRLWDKADYGVEFFITVPDSYYVCATGELIDVDTTAGYATFNWKHNLQVSLPHIQIGIIQHQLSPLRSNIISGLRIRFMPLLHFNIQLI
jgi:hypothetical protein